MVKAEQFAGVSNPKDMGTTGLIAWVVFGGSKRDMDARHTEAVRIFKSRNPKATAKFVAILNSEIVLAG